MSIEDELLERLKDEEDALVERKPVADKDNIRAAACAFANTVKELNTGVLFLGVDAAGIPNGKLTNPDETQRQIRNKYLPRCYPPIEGFQTYAFAVGGKHVVAVVVHESRNRPHFTGPAYNFPGGLALDGAGNLYVADVPRRIRKINAGGGRHYSRRRQYHRLCRWPFRCRSVRQSNWPGRGRSGKHLRRGSSQRARSPHCH